MIKPLNDYVLLEVEPTEKKVGDIILPTNDNKKSHVAKVVAIGEGKVKDGVKEPILVHVGDKVIYK